MANTLFDRNSFCNFSMWYRASWDGDRVRSPGAAGLLDPLQERRAPDVADERADHDAEEERREPLEPVASPAPPSPHHRGQDAENLAQAGLVPGLRERREPVAAEHQRERNHRELLGRCLSPPTQPEPSSSAAAAAGENDEGARARN
ncbi:hypothetical protein U9M48_015728 [Paspalum notatum var. saurae]|uniref:Uncharacterized protein n=1 Tax=Paspalum notatum var. saurae TaxID=547442 RepID=A0AAQ3WLT1_PASNO